ncbi:MAG: hypothetical protein NZ661_08785 [Candidatus Kapabacteria bacterium]|nr:hypothetical protein [Candidatus Kapabacteria bacterium]
MHIRVYSQPYVSILAVLMCIFSNATLYAQSPIDSLNISRITINKAAMITLGAWAVGNIALNGALLAFQHPPASAERPAAYHFQQMNVFWNVVNLGLACAGLYGAYTETPTGSSLFETLSRQSSIENILLFNAGLDIAYIAAGGWMIEHSKNTTSQHSLWKGYGYSLILQGAFLLVFDATVFAIHHITAEPLLRTILAYSRIHVSPAFCTLTFSIPLQ